MKILHLIYDDIRNPWVGGGGAVRAQRVNRRLAQRHDITVVTGNYPGAEDSTVEGVKYRRIGSCKSYDLSRITYVLGAREVIKSMTYDILVEDFTANSPCFSPLFSQKPVAALVLNYYGVNSLRKRKILGIAPFFLEKYGLRLFKHIIVETEAMGRLIKSLIPHDVDVEVIPNGIDNRLFSIQPMEKDYILFVGRLEVYQKGIDILLDAFGIVANRHPGVRLLIIGDTRHKDMPKIKRRVKMCNLKDRVHFLGRIMGNSTRDDLLASCLFLCLPSRYDTMPIISLEAAACGKPIIATDIPGLSDVIKDGRTGILVPPEDQKALAKAMDILLRNRRLRRKMGKEARAWARMFSWDRIAEKQEEFYYRVWTQVKDGGLRQVYQ